MCVCACVSVREEEREREGESEACIELIFIFLVQRSKFFEVPPTPLSQLLSQRRIRAERRSDTTDFFSSPETYYTHDFWGLSLSLTHTHTHTSHSFSSSVCVFMSSSSSSKEKKKQQPEIRTTARRWGESLGRRRERQKFPSKWPIEHKVVVVQKQVFRFSSDATEMIIYFDDNKKGLDFYCWKKLLLS